MVSRRGILNAGIVAAAAPFASAKAILAAPSCDNIPSFQRLDLAHFIVDDRFDVCHNVANNFSSTTAKKHLVSGDLSELWFNYLDLEWKISPNALAGITTESALFYLERLAWIHKLRVVYRGQHNVVANNSISHSLQGSQSLVDKVSSAPQHWQQNLGLAFSECERDVGKQPKVDVNFKQAAPQNYQPHDTVLVSWLMVPTSIGVTQNISL